MKGRIVEIQLLCHGVMHHAAGAYLPQGQFAVITGFARSDGSFIQLAIAPFNTVDLHGGHLHLLVQHHARAAQQPVLQPLIQLGGISKNDRTVPIVQHDRPFNHQRTGLVVIADGGRPNTGGALKRLYVALGDQFAVTGDKKVIGYQHSGTVAVLRSGRQSKRHKKGQEQTAHVSHPLRVKEDQAPRGSTRRAEPMRQEEPGSARSLPEFVQSCE